MARPSKHPVDVKLKIVLSVLSGEVSTAEAARRHAISETSVGNWKQQFLEAGRGGLEAGVKRGPSSRGAALQAQVNELTSALGEAHVELRAVRRGGTPS